MEDTGEEIRKGGGDREKTGERERERARKKQRRRKRQIYVYTYICTIMQFRRYDEIGLRAISILRSNISKRKSRRVSAWEMGRTGEREEVDGRRKSNWMYAKIAETRQPRNSFAEIRDAVVFLERNANEAITND